LRYGLHREIQDQTGLAQAIAFLSSTRRELKMQAAPEILNGNKDLQERWRLIASIRQAVSAFFTTQPEAVHSYWTTLLSYALSFCTYQNISQQAQRFAYLDAAGLFTGLFADIDLKTRQLIFPLDPCLSPPVDLQPEAARSAGRTNLLGRAIIEGRCVIVVGSYLGRAQGVEPLHYALQMLHKDLGCEPPPVVSVRLLLESLSRRYPRSQIVRALKSRTQKVLRPEGVDLLSNRPWAGVVQCQIHSFAWKVLASPSRSRSRVEAESELTALEGQKDTTLYVPLLGDVDSREERAVGSAAEYRSRLAFLGKVGEHVERRRRPLSLLFWKCEDMPVDFLTEIRDSIATHLTSPLDVYVLSDEEDAPREATLDALGLIRVRGRLDDFPEGESARTDTPLGGTRWRRGSFVVNLPDAGHQTRGLLGYFQEMGRLRCIVAGDDEGFLLGSPASREDILNGRVVRREAVGRELLPAIHGAIASRSEQVRVVLVGGRPGAGVSTCLCIAAHELDRDEVCPIAVVARNEGYGKAEWQQAGEIASEIAQLCKRPSVVFWEATDGAAPRVEDFAEGASRRKGEVVLVLGGRIDVVHEFETRFNVAADWCIEIPDRLSETEAQALAGILQENGFSAGVDRIELSERIRRVGILLPAIYEATDHRNRKFRDIVAFEYRRYDRDQLTQRAYRLVCLVSAYGHRIGQFWLLKAIGSASIHEAPIILGRLSADVVRESEDSSISPDDVLFSARHRIIAEEVLSIAYAEPSHRLVDLKVLIRNANMANPEEGGTVAAMLLRKGALMRWLREAFEGRDEAYYGEARALYEEALRNKPISPYAEATLRQQFALLLRWFFSYDEAIAQAEAAYELDRSNVASIHVLGLVHEARAIAAWRSVAVSPQDGKALGAAFADEKEACTFFRESRAMQPRQEYGYESEARYLRKRADVLSKLHTVNASPEARELVKEARRGLYSALDLLRQAERHVPYENQKEVGETKTRVLACVGDLGDALKVLEGELGAAKGDPVRRIKLLSLGATLAAEMGRWSDCTAYCKSAIESGHHTAWIYSVLDEALRQDGIRDERKRFLRESAETWNKEDLQTLLTWAGFCIEEGEWERAQDAIRSTDEISRRQGLSHFEREKIKGRLKKRLPDGREEGARFSGVVERLTRSYEGRVRIDGVRPGVTLHFRVGDDTASRIAIGTRVSFEVAWRMTGLSAMDLRLEDG
jgi:tetratricopeptide (TPR) repeat protein